jgi:hypothetical protein
MSHNVEVRDRTSVVTTGTEPTPIGVLPPSGIVPSHLHPWSYVKIAMEMPPRPQPEVIATPAVGRDRGRRHQLQQCVGLSGISR